MGDLHTRLSFSLRCPVLANSTAIPIVGKGGRYWPIHHVSSLPRGQWGTSWTEVTVRASHPTEFISSRFIIMLPSSLPWIFTFQNIFRCAGSFYFTLSWQANISLCINWGYNPPSLCSATLPNCVCYSAPIQKGINLNYMMLWLSP